MLSRNTFSCAICGIFFGNSKSRDSHRFQKHKYTELFDTSNSIKGGDYVKQLYERAFYISTHKVACQNALQLIPDPSQDTAEFRDDGEGFREAQFCDRDEGYLADCVTTLSGD